MTESRTFKPFSDEQLQDMETRFGPIHVYTPPPPAKSRWAKAEAPAPEPRFELVFRACTPGEWGNIRAQLNDDRRKAAASDNLAKATVIAVSIGGKQTINAGAVASDREAAKPAREALEALIEMPGNTAVCESFSDELGALNGLVKAQAEKG